MITTAFRTLTLQVASDMLDDLDTSPAAVWARLVAWPRGWFVARYQGRRYGVSNVGHANGRSFKFFAEELGGPDRISLNIYAPPSGALALRPCEMPIDKVTAFVLGAELEAAEKR